MLAGQDGVRAYRLGATGGGLERRRLPPLARAARRRRGARRRVVVARRQGRTGPARPPPGPLQGFPGRVVAAALGDAEGNGQSQLAVSFWRPYRRTDVNALIPRSQLVNRRGLTAHVGIYRPGSRAELWVAGTLLQPVARLSACDGSLAVAYADPRRRGRRRCERRGMARLRLLAARGASRPRNPRLRGRRRRRPARSRHTRPERRMRRTHLIGTALLLGTVALANASCGGSSGGATTTSTSTTTATTTAAAPASLALPAALASFGDYEAVPLIGPDSPAYTGPADSALAGEGLARAIRAGRAQGCARARAAARRAGAPASSARGRACSSCRARRQHLRRLPGVRDHRRRLQQLASRLRQDPPRPRAAGAPAPSSKPLVTRLVANAEEAGRGPRRGTSLAPDAFTRRAALRARGRRARAESGTRAARAEGESARRCAQGERRYFADHGHLDRLLLLHAPRALHAHPAADAGSSSRCRCSDR